jgi:hypothetical protein
VRRKLQRFTKNTITSYAALVAELASIHDQGYALDHGEHESQVRCVATPIFDMKGNVIAALSVSGPEDRMEPIERNRPMIENARETARNISPCQQLLQHTAGVPPNGSQERGTMKIIRKQTPGLDGGPLGFSDPRKYSARPALRIARRRW